MRKVKKVSHTRILLFEFETSHCHYTIGFVSLSQIHRLVAPADHRETIKLLVPKKLLEARVRIANDVGFDPVRQDGTHVFVHFELALLVVAHRRVDLKVQCHIWLCDFGNAIKQLVQSVPELGARLDTVFGNTGIRYTRIDGKFYFAAADMTKLVLWDEETQTPCQRDLSIYVDRAGAVDDVLRAACSHTHQFGQVSRDRFLKDKCVP